MSTTLLTPKDLASAIGASESSLRRWIDNGDIRISRTAGGHRRIPVSEAVQFVRKMGARVLRPEVLGLGNLRELAANPAIPPDEELFEALKAGDRHVIRSIILSWYLDGRALAALFDGPVRTALNRVGDLWHHDRRGIMVEHRATDLAIAALSELRSLLPERDDECPLAAGAAPQNDPYVIPSIMASAVLQEMGFCTVNFGANTPIELLGREAIERGVKLVWLAISATMDARLLQPPIRQLAADLKAVNIDLVVGGAGAERCAPRDAGIQIIASMTELAGFAKALSSRPHPASPV